MDDESPSCIVCENKEFENDENHFRKVCLMCNAMQEPSGIGVTSFGFNNGINFRALASVRMQPKKRQVSQMTLARERQEKIEVFKLEEMFQWIFRKQVESLRPFVSDWDKFHTSSETLWRQYLEHTGSEFDIVDASVADISEKKYPMGWGVSLDPRRGDETLMITPREYFKLKRQETESHAVMDLEKHKENAKKLKIEKMVVSKTREKRSARVHDISSSETESDEGPNSFSVSKDILHGIASDRSFSDEDDPSYISMFDLKETEKKKVRILRRKKPHEVRYTGGRARGRQLLMENNLLLLYFALHFTNTNEQYCCLMDVLALAKRGTIPYLKITRFLPTDKFFLNHTVFQSLLLRDQLPSYSKLKQCGFHLAETIKLDTLLKVDTSPLIMRMVRQLNLPLELLSHIDFIKVIVEKELDKQVATKAGSKVIVVGDRWISFKKSLQYVLFFEAHCLVYIFTALRMVLRMDGRFELEVSRLASNLDRLGVETKEGTVSQKLFIWEQWLQEVYIAPSISNATSWADLEEVTCARDFLEQEEDSSEEQGLERSSLVNIAGRFVQPYKHGTHQEVLDSLAKVFSMAEQKKRTPKTSRDMTTSSLCYLEDPEFFRSTSILLPPEARPSVLGASSTFSSAVDELVRVLLLGQQIHYAKLGLDPLRFPEGVFEDVLKRSCLCPSESRLLQVFERKFGIDRDFLYATAASLDKVIIGTARRKDSPWSRVVHPGC